MLPKFIGLENAYLFLREFEEICSMIHIPNIPIDVARMKLIPFTLKDSANTTKNNVYAHTYLATQEEVWEEKSGTFQLYTS